MKRMHKGRLRDSWQVPHRNRRRYKVNFHLSNGLTFSSIVAVPNPVDENLRKYRDEVIEANREIWVRPKQEQVYLGTKNGAPTYEVRNVKDARGRQIMTNMLRKVTADFLGADA